MLLVTALTVIFVAAISHGSPLKAKLEPLVVAIGKCEHVQFEYCQGQFNKAVGIDETLTYTSGRNLTNIINRLLITTTDEILRICRARQQFYMCFGTEYNQCMDRLYLLQQPNANLVDVFYYSHLFAKLDFICNGGFEEVVNQWGCIHGATTLNTYAACEDAFNTGVSSNVNAVCGYVETFMNCAKQLLQSETQCNNKAAGWWGCEAIRAGYGAGCPDLRCRVQTA